MTNVAHQLAADIERELPELLSLLERLVNIDSGSYHASGVNAVIDLVADQLTRLGFAIERTRRSRGAATR
jgi:glutamate carboxypeptidase